MSINYDFLKACRVNSIGLVKLLLEHEADVHAYSGCALKWASEKGHTDVVKLLLKHGADVHATNNYALRWANYYGHTNVVKLLVEYGAKL